MRPATTWSGMLPMLLLMLMMPMRILPMRTLPMLSGWPRINRGNRARSLPPGDLPRNVPVTRGNRR